ncbi:protein EMSY-LIKE 3 isoform X2 [Jatropha curcas]|uniref:protein EMSY-LIKE 3 isoform X2 n=1 Tax=Jatropha curcas TaxID=180498 RepID=UPI0009D6FEBF|nr:protein EMSY-LIKE 3 isoform X2 [Jatropha curcas]
MMHNIKNPPCGYSSGTPRTSLLKESCGRDETDINFQIHSMEKEAYCSVLRAFIAQSDLLSWGKEGLITELRKELNVTDIEHGQLLVKINSDEAIKRIREWQKGAHESLSAKVDSPGLVTTPVDHSPQKKRRPSHPPLAKSQKYVLHDQPSSSTIPSLPPAYFKDKQHVEFNNHSVKVVNHNVPHGNKGGLAQSRFKRDIHVPDSGKFKNHPDFIQIRATDTVIHEVEMMAYGYGRKNPDPIQLEKAKLILREHERAILDVLNKLSDASDDASDFLGYKVEGFY